ncbi:sugar kinase [Paenibacillus radicis (ex Gao et al. 2016)]|uniref:Sugar kinase n=1 Tax=Paenibacillus radicis (ex Gao et al. 2016) TaxID=1737354 RepID=A0A917HCH9_9BACL|nr:sugar kinase [Paenibacillus radicis (ex Gao et al. 2016)]GGG74644.1 sugar kinase [Paenibacillus radicis (ex Gao et al. 2016)]
MHQTSPDIITFGESMALFMPPEHKALERATVLEQGFGGAESNVAIGIARLGGSAGWFGVLGDDPFGKMILKTLRGEGVDVSRSILSSDAPTGMMFREHVAGRTAVHYYRKHSAASRMEPEQLDEQYIRGAKLLHVTGITTALSESSRRTVLRAIEIAKEAGVKVCFDPNLRLKLWSIEEARETLLPIAEQADYFLPGWDELKLLYNTDSFEEVKEKLLQLNAVTIVKGFGDTTLVLDNGKETLVPFYPAEKVIDTVGAGDGFCAGFLAGIMRGMTPAQAVGLASINGSLVVQMRGDWEALPEWSAVEQRMSDKVWVER